jgi:hypothetical protein
MVTLTQEVFISGEKLSKSIFILFFYFFIFIKTKKKHGENYMKKKTNKKVLGILLVVTLVLILINLSYISAEFWACANYRERINYCDDYKEPKICYDTGGCEYCMSVYNEEDNCYIHGVWPQCNQVQRECTFTEGEGAGIESDGTPPELNLFSPAEGDIFDSRKVLFDFYVNEPSTITYLDNNDDRKRWKTICSNCQGDYSRGVNFKDGEQNITIKAKDRNNNQMNVTRSFYVDSSGPRIRGTEPRRGFANGIFSVEFSEENPKNLTLFYGLIGETAKEYSVDLENECVKGDRNTECETFVDVSEFDGETIEYWFELEDIAESKDESRSNELQVDITKPEISNFDYKVDGRKVYFSMDVDEKNLNSVYYVDNNDERAREKSICRRLDGTYCEGRGSFKDGKQNITIYAFDEAGNYDKIDLSFFVDSKDPKISKTEPRRGFASGFFSVEFKEENPKNLTLFYGLVGEGPETEELDLGLCVDSRGKTYCDVEVDLTAYSGNEIEYWFELTDILDQKDVSKKNELEVDTDKPIILNENFWEQDSENDKYIYFNIEIEEKNFDQVGYWEEDRGRNKFRRLCSRLDKEDRDDVIGTCEKKKTFRSGDHVLEVVAYDEVGLESEIFEVEFSVL